jgi:hypothetical protein
LGLVVGMRLADHENFLYSLEDTASGCIEKRPLAVVSKTFFQFPQVLHCQVHVHRIRWPYSWYVIPAGFWRGSKHLGTLGFQPGTSGNDNSTGHSIVSRGTKQIALALEVDRLAMNGEAVFIAQGCNEGSCCVLPRHGLNQLMCPRSHRDQR